MAVNSDISYVNSDINYYKKLISQSEDTVKIYYEDKLKYAENRLSYLQDELKRSKDDAKQKATYQSQVDSLKAVRNNIEYKINQLMIPKISQQNFMFWASIAFVLLMLILLYTFFKVVNTDINVRVMIFGSDSGIQFVTLFSIIIAIILFGLTGVLEGKELSALLGSVAGYILGKAKFSNEKATPIAQAKPEDKPEAKPEDNKKQK